MTSLMRLIRRITEFLIKGKGLLKDKIAT